MKLTAHEIVLQKKHDRLTKHNGSLLRRKTKKLYVAIEAYNRLGNLFANIASQPGISVVEIAVEPPDPKFIEAVKEGLTDVEAGRTVLHEEVKAKIIATFKVSVPPYTAEPFDVHASNERDARKVAREHLNVPKLPVGTLFEKIA